MHIKPKSITMTEQQILLVTVVRRTRGDRVVELARAAGATGSTVLLGRGTVNNKWLALLCLADTGKEIVFTIAREKIMPNIISALQSAPDLCKKAPGIGFTVNVNLFLRSGLPFAQENKENYEMKEEINRQLICVIANEGYSDDIMHAARHAGARGGTIIRARGTGTEEDSSFFGIHIVPEKELVMILVKNIDLDPILNAIRSLPCLAEQGVGIVFTLPVTSFFPLGLTANEKK